MPFKLYLDGDGKPQFNDKGLPLFLDDGASEPVPIDVDGLHEQMRARSGELAARRKEKEELAVKLKLYEGLDPEAARKALDTMKLLDEGKLIEAGKVDEVRQKAVAEERQKVENLAKALEDTKAEGAKAVQEKEQIVHNLLVKDAIAGSTFLREKTYMTPMVAYSDLGKHFSVEYQDGNPVVIARDGHGNILLSTVNPGQNASPEEAIRLLFDQHPERDLLLKTPVHGGSGTPPGSGRSMPGVPQSMAECKTEADKIAYLKAKTA